MPGGEFPAHASPAIVPLALSSPDNKPTRNVSSLNLDNLDNLDDTSSAPPLVSPTFASSRPPFDSADGQRHDRDPDFNSAGAAAGAGTSGAAAAAAAITPSGLKKSVEQGEGEVEDVEDERPRLMQELPEVTCEVRARIPTTTGTEMWLHLYHNNADEKEHLAIVFGPHIRSRSLDAPRQGESERDRMIRGAYAGTLYPGRVSSRVDQLRRDAGVSPSSPRPLHSAGSGSSLSEESSASVSEEVEPSYPPHLGPPLVRIHSECYTGETVWSARCDCGEQLDEAARLMSAPIPSPISTPGSETSGSGTEGQLQLGGATPKLPPCGGVIIYLRQEGRGIGLLSKLKAYNLQDLGHDTMEANLLLRHPGDARSYGLATAMLLDLGLGGDRGIKLLTNNPEKVRAVEGPNREVKVVQRVPMIPLAWKTKGKEGVHGPEVERYISTKIEKFKHMFSE